VCLENRKERLYLANSKDLVRLLRELDLAVLWPTLKLDRHSGHFQQPDLEHTLKADRVIKRYRDNEAR